MFHNKLKAALDATTTISKEIFTVDIDTRNILANMCNLNSRITYNMCRDYFFLLAGRSPEQRNDVIIIHICKPYCIV